MLGLVRDPMRGLIIGEADDNDLDLLQHAGFARNIPIDWFELGRRSTDYDVTWLSSDPPVLKAPGLELSVSQLSRYDWVFYKRAAMTDPSFVVAEVGSSVENDFAMREWSALFESALMLFRDQSKPRWVTPHGRAEFGNRKLYVLDLASRLGLRVPAFTVATRFVSPNGYADLVTKAINKNATIDEERYFPTTALRNEDVVAYSGQRAECPTLVQAKIARRKEMRIFYVSGSFVGRSIVPESNIVDIRYAKTARATALEASPATLKSLESLCRDLGVNYCSFDLLVDAGGNEWLTDVTPNGSWSWYEQITGADFTSEILDALCARLP